jgi:Family of unknown function (DUF5995)
MDDVIDGLDHVVRWSVKHRSRIGYFAALYKRLELAILEALKAGRFEDANQIRRLGVAFATRYFKALNDYHIGKHGDVPLVWRLAFKAHLDRRLSVVQQIFLPVNAHVCYDLGLALAQVGGHSLPAWRSDFDLVNDIARPTLNGYYDAAVGGAPLLGLARRFVPYESLIGHIAFSSFRTVAWHFAAALTEYPHRAPQIITAQCLWANALGTYYRQPLLTPVLGLLVPLCERGDVVAIIRGLESGGLDG